ncbi:hypothetical protein D3C84_1099900 [compost metagenome]
MLRVVENLHFIMAAAKRRAHVQNAVAYNNDRIRLAILPERAVRQLKAADRPHFSFIQNRIKIA